MEFNRFEFKEGILTRTKQPNKIVIPSEIDGQPVLEIGDGAFARMNLTEVVIGDSVTRIRREAFAGNNLADIKLPNNLKSIDDYAFHANKLENIKIPLNVEAIAYGAFGDNMRIESLTVPPSVTYIDESAFMDTNGYFKFICVEDSYAHEYARRTGTPTDLLSFEEFLKLYE